MNKNLYLDVHVLQTVPPSCVNRDDTGSPKMAVYGGVNRARVSSQAWKRAMRERFKEIFSDDEIGYRTKRIKALIADKLKQLAPKIEAEEIDKIADKAMIASKIKSDKGKDVLFFISSLQIEALAKVALEYNADPDTEDDKKKKYKDAWNRALNENPSIDIVLFGRMAASNPELNCEAAAQVAHCISTHEVINEYDYFTAVDDCNEEEQPGAGHLGTVEFNSSTLYRYATVNVTELYDSELNKEEVCHAVKGFLEAFIRSMPTGKQNSFANRTIPYFVYVTVREDQPINMAGAFEKPISKSRDGYEKRSAEELVKYSDKVYENYADKPRKSWIVCLDDIVIDAERVKLDDLYEAVAKEVCVDN